VRRGVVTSYFVLTGSGSHAPLPKGYCCFGSFLRLTRYKPAIVVGDEQYTAAELFTLESVNTAKMEIENHIEWAAVLGHAPDEEVMRDLQRRYQDTCALHEGLLAWSKNWNLEKAWVYEFGHFVLMDYWQKNHKPARALPPPVLPRQAVAPKLPAVTQRAEEAKAKPMVQLGTPSQLSKFNTERLLASWRSAVWELVRETEMRMTAPEEKWENKIAPRLGVFSRLSAEESTFHQNAD
jgi:hypothetical protein